jgi:hypothetical protein
MIKMAHRCTRDPLYSKFPYIVHHLGIVGRLFLPNVRSGEEIHLRALLLFILLLSRYDLSVAHDLLCNIREFIRLRLGRTRSDYKRRDSFRSDRLPAVGNRRKVAEEVIVVKKTQAHTEAQGVASYVAVALGGLGQHCQGTSLLLLRRAHSF